jgi:hypothetical protein
MARLHIDNIISAFAFLENKIQLYSHLNLQDINIHLENILRDLLNVIYSDRTFVNLNSEEGNFTAIDLGDNKKDISFQVTSTTNKKKFLILLRNIKMNIITKKYSCFTLQTKNQKGNQILMLK